MVPRQQRSQEYHCGWKLPISGNDFSCPVIMDFYTILETLQFTSSDTTEVNPGISVPGWAWAVVAIGVVGLIVTILLVAIIILTRRRKEPK